MRAQKKPCPTCGAKRHHSSKEALDCARQAWRVAVRNLGLERGMRKIAQDRLNEVEWKRPPNPVWVATMNCGRCSQPATVRITTSPTHHNVETLESEHKCGRSVS